MNKLTHINHFSYVEKFMILISNFFHQASILYLGWESLFPYNLLALWILLSKLPTQYLVVIVTVCFRTACSPPPFSTNSFRTTCSPFSTNSRRTACSPFSASSWAYSSQSIIIPENTGCKVLETFCSHGWFCKNTKHLFF